MGYGYAYDGVGSRCLGGEQPGVRALANFCDRKFFGVSDWGIYNCRGNTGGSGLSVHAEGRAWDAGISTVSAGHPLAEWLVKHAEALGVQLVIYNRRSWNAMRRTWAYYGGASPHTDHVHVELCWAAARGLTTAAIEAVDQEDELTPDQAKKLDDIHEWMLRTVRNVEGADAAAKADGDLVPTLRNIVNRIARKVGASTTP